MKTSQSLEVTIIPEWKVILEFWMLEALLALQPFLNFNKTNLTLISVSLLLHSQP